MIELDALFDSHFPRLVEVAAAVLGSRTEAEDVVQEAFLKAHRARATFRGEASPATWLRRIVLHEAIEVRRRRRLPRASHEPELLPATQGDPGARASEVERAAAVRRAVDALPEDQRTVIVLRELEGMGYREIAEMLEIPMGTVESRVLRAREKLRAALRAHLPDRADVTKTDAGADARPGAARGAGA